MTLKLKFCKTGLPVSSVKLCNRPTILYLLAGLILLTGRVNALQAGSMTGPPKAREINIASFPSETLMMNTSKGRRLVFVCSRRFQFYDPVSLKHDFSINVPREVSVFDSGDVDNDGHDDLVFYDGRELSVHLHRSGRFIKMAALEVDSDLPGSDRQLGRMQIILPYTESDARRLLFPVRSAYQVFTFQKKEHSLYPGYKMPLYASRSVSDRFWKNSDTRRTTFIGKIEVPRPYLTDLDADGRADFLLPRKNSFSIYLSEGEWWKRKGSLHTRVSLAGSYAHDFRLLNLNNDRLPELVFTVIRGSGVDIASETYIYTGIKGGFNRKPVTIKTPGGFYTPLDISAMGTNYLLVPQIDIGIPFVWQYLVNGRLRINIQFYAASNNFTEPLNSTTVNYEVAGSLLPGFARGRFLDTDAFAVGLSPSTLAVYGLEKGEPVKKLDLACKSYGIFRTLDIDQNGKTDLVIVYPINSKKHGYRTNRATVVLF